MPGNAVYQVRTYDPLTGATTGVITSWRSLFIEHTLNSFSTLQLSVNTTDPVVALFKLDAIVEVWRRINRPGAQWYREGVFLHRSEQMEFTATQLRIFTSYSRGLLDLLHRRNIEYPATTAFTLKQGPGETVLKQFVNENAGPAANHALRYSFNTWNPVVPGLTIEVDTGAGLTWQGARAGQNLLDVLKEVATVSNVDYTIERTGPLEFEFQTRYPQLGEDRTAHVLFSLDLGNMTDVNFTRSRTEEGTVVVVAGQGEGDTRIVYRARGNEDAIDDSPFNIIEIRKDGRSQPTFNELKSEADQALEEQSAQDNIVFKVLQTSQRQYGAEYFLGDRVKFKFEDIVGTAKIVGVSLRIAEGMEEIDVELGNLPRRL